jgi:RimJ/RimL family protein N-acetyltransferase
VELRNLTLDDLPLYEATYADVTMMEHLGGPRPKEGLAEKLARDVATTEAGDTWILVIVDEASGEVAGSIALWEEEWNGERINEMGWMVLPAFQGRGIGSAAVRAVLDRARTEGRWSTIHAFPPVTNAASNAICRSTGFRFIGEIELSRWLLLRCNHWRIDLA